MKKVRFSLSARTGKLLSRREEVFTFKELDIDEKSGSEEEQKAVHAAYQEWLKTHVDSYFEIIN